MKEIKCSEGLFKSKVESTEYLEGLDIKVLNRYINSGRKNGLSESDVIKRVMLCNKIKKEFNLKCLPQYTNIVLFHGKYYPSVNYISKLMSWNGATVLKLMHNGMSIEEVEQYYCNNRMEEFLGLLKKGVDKNSKVFIENGELVLEVYGKRYNSLSGLLAEYNTTYSTFRNRLKLPDTSICQALNIKESRKSFSFLGRDFDSVAEFGRFYNLSADVSQKLLKDINKAENLFKWIHSVVKESRVSYNGGVGWLIVISKNLIYNKEDVIYQIQNYANLKEGYTYYFDGKSYLTLEEFYNDMTPKICMGRTERLFIEEREKISLFKIPGILNGTFEVTFKSIKFYIYLYFYDFLKHSLSHFDFYLNEIYDMLREGTPAIEIKNLLIGYRLLVDSAFKNSPVGSKSRFISTYLSGSITKNSLLNYFNLNLPNVRTTGLKKFLQYSDIKIIKASYKFNSLQYYLCERNGGLCYLSGNDLLGIAVESVK